MAIFVTVSSAAALQSPRVSFQIGFISTDAVLPFIMLGTPSIEQSADGLLFNLGRSGVQEYRHQTLYPRKTVKRITNPFVKKCCHKVIDQHFQQSARYNLIIFTDSSFCFMPSY